MNKIKFKNNEITLLETDDLITVSLSDKFELFDIKKIEINVFGNTELEIIYENKEETKLDIEYNIKENISFKVTEIRKENKIKVQYIYNLDKNSHLKVMKFYDVLEAKELCVVNLNGEQAKFDYVFKTIAKDKNKYDVYVYHNYPKTVSNIINNSVNIDNGTTIFNVTGVVYNGISKCLLEQKNKIINLNDKECIIKPNLLIEDNDIIANHSAFIGKFRDEEIFYLMSRGISYQNALSLLIKGFLKDGIDNKKIDKIINKYWR